MMSSRRVQSAGDRFVPHFGEKGELRQKVGSSGRAHLDRWLPFLVLNGSAAPAQSIARRVAINSPAYLIWSSEEEREAAAALDAMVRALHERFGPVLLVSLEDWPLEHQQADSPTLPAFVIGVGAEGDERAKKALDAFTAAVATIEIELRHPIIEFTASTQEPILDRLEAADRLSVKIPQIHRAPNGKVYPQITHELALAIGDALLRAAAAFLADIPGAPAHHRSLGRSAILAAALHADAKLDAIARSFDFLLSLSPINTREAMHEFFDASGERPPRFRYRPLTIDPDEAKSELYKIDLAILEDPVLERLLSEKRREIDYQLTLLATRNTTAFRFASMLLYGPVAPELLVQAQTVVESNGPCRIAGRTLSARDVAAAAENLVASYRLVDRRFDAKVEVRDDVAGLLVSGSRLMIGSDTRVAPGRLDALLAHEVSVHLLTSFNGAAQGLTIFRTGLAHYECIQEGFAVFAEWAVGGLTANRLRLLAGRVIAVNAMIDGADFVQVYRRLTADLGFGRSSAFGIAARVFRSGGFAKDAIYLKGFRQVLEMVAAKTSLDPFWLGKIAPDHVQAVEELLLRGLLHPPVYVPEFLARAEAQRRIARLRAGLPFDRILEPE